MKTTTYRNVEIELHHNDASGLWGAAYQIPDKPRAFTGYMGSRRDAFNEATRMINVFLERQNAQAARARYDAAGGQEKHVENANREYYLQKADEYRRRGLDNQASYYEELAAEHHNTVKQLRGSAHFRAGFKKGMKSAFTRYQDAGGSLPFLKWAAEVFGPEIWNELFQAKHSSHVVSLNGLTRADGRRVTRGYK